MKSLKAPSDTEMNLLIGELNKKTIAGFNHRPSGFVFSASFKVSTSERGQNLYFCIYNTFNVSFQSINQSIFIYLELCKAKREPQCFTLKKATYSDNKKGIRIKTKSSKTQNKR